MMETKNWLGRKKEKYSLFAFKEKEALYLA